MPRVTSFLTAYVRGKGKTLKYEFAVLAFGLEAIFLVRLLISSDPVWIAAQQGNFGTFTWAVFAYVAAAVGLQTLQNMQPGQPTYTQTTFESPAGDDREPTADEVSRSPIG